jgi:hypothetical protein
MRCENANEALNAFKVNTVIKEGSILKRIEKRLIELDSDSISQPVNRYFALRKCIVWVGYFTLGQLVWEISIDMDGNAVRTRRSA